MNRDEQEMALWREAYTLAMSQTWDYAKAEEAASAAIEAFRKRYPATPTAPPAVWYDEPPFAKNGSTRPCWIAGEPFACAVYWSGHEWRVYFTGDSHVQRLNGRRVFPIVKPQEPPQ